MNTDAGVTSSFKQFFQTHWRGAGIAFGIMVLLLCIWPLAFVKRSASGWQQLYVYSTYVYSIFTVLTFFVLLGAALFAGEQLRENKRTKKLNLVMDLNRYYSSQEMGQAIHAVWKTKPKPGALEQDEMARAAFVVHKANPAQLPTGIEKEWRMHNQRRMVSDYLNMVAWAIKEGLIEMEFIYSRFGKGAFDIWTDRVLPIEFELRKLIESDRLKDEIQQGKRHPMRDAEIEAEVTRCAEHHTKDELPTTRVAREYKEFVERLSKETKNSCKA